MNKAAVSAVRDIWRAVSGWGPVLRECARDIPDRYKCGQTREQEKRATDEREEMLDLSQRC